MLTDISSDSEEDGANPDRGKVNIAIDSWLKFKCDSDTANLLVHLRQKWHALVLRRLANPSKQLSQSDEVNIIVLIWLVRPITLSYVLWSCPREECLFQMNNNV